MVSGKKARPITQPNFKAHMYLLYTSTVHVATTDGSTVQKVQSAKSTAYNCQCNNLLGVNWYGCGSRRLSKAGCGLAD
jgi:hypothetical protein